MLDKLKRFFAADVPEIKANLALLVSQKKQESTESTLMRHLLGSIDLKDVKPIELKEGERKDFAASIAIVTPKLQRIMKQLIEEHKDYALAHDGNPDFQKGTLNGFYLALEEFENWQAEHIENTKPKEEFDQFQTLPQLLERVSRQAGLPSTEP